MARFICKVITPQGQIVKLRMKEKDKISCLKKLKRNGMTPVSVQESFEILKLGKYEKNVKKSTATIYSRKKKRIKIKKDYVVNFSKKVTIQEIREFTEDFYLLKKLDFTNKHAIITIINKVENVYLKDALRSILKNLEENKFMYKAMKEYTDIFPAIYVNLIKTGELTKTLEDSLKYAITYLKDEEKIRKQVQNDLIPNIIAFFGILIILILALLIGLPNLQNIFESYGGLISLPKITLITFGIAKTIIKYWYIFVILILISIGIFIKIINTDKGKYKFDRFKYTNSLFGKIMFLLDCSRVIRSIFLNLQNNIRTQDALEISKNVTNNLYILNLLEKSINDVYVGKSWIDSFENEEMLNPMIIEMLKKGLKTKSIENMGKSIEYLDKEIGKEIERTLKILSEISYGIVGIALLLFIIIVLIPCLQIYLGGILFI